MSYVPDHEYVMKLLHLKAILRDKATPSSSIQSAILGYNPTTDKYVFVSGITDKSLSELILNFEFSLDGGTDWKSLS